MEEVKRQEARIADLLAHRRGPKRIRVRGTERLLLLVLLLVLLMLLLLLMFLLLLLLLLLLWGHH